MSTYEPTRKSNRSRSPADRAHYKRQRSPHMHSHRSHSKRSKPTPSIALPFKALPLSKSQYTEYMPMFGLYLDIQKHKALEDVPEDEVRGRWKSFVHKWNRGELAEGWYDPTTLHKAQASAAADSDSVNRNKLQVPSSKDPDLADSSDDDVVGPTLPGQETLRPGKKRKPGPSIPNMQDLELQRELQNEDLHAQRQDLRQERRADRISQRQALDELVPRAEAGSKERLLEKKREKADSNRAFASAKHEAGAVEEVPESDLLGDEDGGIEGYKKQKKEVDRKKNEREVRREEVLRVRMEEREERIRNYKAKEEKTMSGLVAIAKARFG